MKYQTQLIRIAATFILFVLLTATFLPTSAQTIRRVTTAGDAGADGSTWEASMTLQAALAASDSLDQVWIAAGTYKPDATDRTATFSVPAGVLVYGGFDPVADATDIDASSRSGEATILSGDLLGDDIARPATEADQTAYDTTRDDNSYTVVTIGGADVTLDGLTIQSGQGGNLADSQRGAGLYAGAGITGTTLTDCTFTGNESVGSGGGAYFRGTATLTACTFTGNVTDSGGGGGAYFEVAATLTACTFTGNVTDSGSGGGAWCGGVTTLTNCVLTGNRGVSGGGLFLGGSDGTVINSTLYNNSAGDKGGGLYVARFSFPFILQNSILVGNTAINDGDQVYVNTNAADVATLQNNLIAGGADPMGTDQGVVYNTPGSGNITQTGTVDATAAAVFASTDAMNANYLRLKGGSPAVNAGKNSFIPEGITTDAAGRPRILDRWVDLGAYESGLIPQVITFTSPAAGVVGTDLELTVTASSGLPVTFEIATQTPSSGAENVATLTDNTLTLTGLGTVTITATQAGNADYAMTTQTQTITSRPAGAVIFRVTTNGAATRDGSSWANAMTLQAALAASITAGDQVWIAEGTYRPHNRDREVTFSVSAGVLVYGGFAGGETTLARRANRTTILSGSYSEGSRTVVTLTGANITLDGLTISGGQGGTDLDGTGPNTTFGGAGLYAGVAATGATLTDCIFTNNSADDYGGGAYFEGIATLTGCTFTDNEAEGNGGGAYLNGTATLANCVLVGNSAVNGGGLWFNAGGTVVNLTLYNNTATERGGGIFAGFFTNNPFNLQNSLLMGNTATMAGNAIYLVDGAAPLSATDIEATIGHNLIGGGMVDLGVGLYDEDASTYTAVLFTDATNVALTNTIEESDVAAVFASTDATEDDYLRLKAGSLAVNAGNNDYLNNGTPDPDDDFTTDAEGRPRILDGTVDVGAYESGMAPQAITFTSPATGAVGGKIGLTATGGNSGLPITFAITEGESRATLAGTTLILTGVGEVVVTASQAGNANYVMTTQTQTITVRNAVIRRVMTSGAGMRDGSSWANAMPLQAALGSAIVGDQIWIADGIYTPDADDRTVTFSVPGGVFLYGGFSGDEASFMPDDPTTPENEDIRTRDPGGALTNVTILSGDLLGDDGTRPVRPVQPAAGEDQTAYNAALAVYNTALAVYNNNTRREENSHTVVTLAGANATLDGLTIQSGERGTFVNSRNDFRTFRGAGLYAGTGITGITLTGCAFTNNGTYALGGGGGAYLEGIATLTGCTFTSNRADGGGGAYFAGAATLTNCAFTDNGAIHGGGGAHFYGTSTLTGCTFTSNESNVSGGAYFSGTSTLTDCTFTGNGEGGARFAGAATLTGCTFTDNEYGGAEFYGTSTLTGCAFIDNEGGGAVFYGGATLANCVVVDNLVSGLGFIAGGTVINSTFYNNGIWVSFDDTDSRQPGVQTNPFILRNSLLMVADVSVNNTDAAHLVNIQNNLIAGGAHPLGTDQGVVYTTPGSANITEENTVDESDVAVVFASTDPMSANYLRLADGSPAATAGNNDYLNNGTPGNPNDDITTDAAGEIRIQGGTVDVGAYESDLKLAQAITFTAPAAGELGDTIILTTTTNSGLSVTLVITDQTPTSGTGNVVTLMGDVLILTSTGTVTITASQAGDATYVPATVMQTITVRPVGAVIFRVTTTGAGNQSGSSWANAATLQAALAAAVVADDQIWIAAGKYHPVTLANDTTTATNEERAATFNIPTSVLVYGGFAGDEASFMPDDPTTPENEDIRTRDPGGVLTNVTTLSGDLLNDDGTRPVRPVQPAAGEDQTAYNAALVAYNAARAAYNTRREENSLTVVTLTGANTTLDGLTITAGEGGTDLDGAGSETRIGGAGLYAGTGITGITLMGCAFNNNSANGNGGGAYFREAATLTACTFTGNTAGFGGGAHFYGTSTLTGCAFTDNEAQMSGGGAIFSGASTLTGCTFTDNATIGRGGGAYFGASTLTGCIFTGNEAEGGGGGAIFDGTATLTACAFTDNDAGEGGGAYFTGASTLTGCTFTGNEAEGGYGGGAIFEGTSTLTLTACTFTNNEATHSVGGAYFVGSATLTNCVVVGNRARSGGGGGLWFYSGGTVINSTFYNNTATDLGGGIRVGFSDADLNMVGVQNFPFILQNSLLIGNTVAGVARQVFVNNTDATHLVNIQNNLIEGGADPLGTDQGVRYTTPGAENITEENTVDESDVAVVFASTDAMNTNYLRLADGSPAATAGNNDYLNNGTPGNPNDDITTDAAGEIRIQGGTVDVGAYESDLKLAQAITFTAPAAGELGDTIILTTTTNSGLSVTLVITDQTPTSGTGNVVTLMGDVLILTSTGTVTITASQAGDATYVPATVMQTITVRPVGAVIFRVTTTGAGNQSGSSWANAATLQAALAAAVVADDQIWIAAGKYHPVTLANDTTTATNEERAATFNIPTSVLVYGGFAGDEASFMPDDPTTPENEDIRTRDPGGVLTNVTTLSGDLLNDDGTRPVRPVQPAAGEDQTAYNAALVAYNAARAAYNTRREENSLTVVTLTGANTTLDGLTITAGEGGTDLDGAGSETRIGGAGLYAGTGITGITLMGCAFNNNSANGNGGGAYFREAATLTACTFTGNTAGFGGGAHFYGTSTLTGCAFTDNEAQMSGGGAIFSGASTLTGCTFTDNATIGRGGGAYFGASTLTGCIFTGNEAEGGGGGAIFDGTATLTACAFTDNDAGEGGGAYFTGASTLTGCTFTGNEAEGGYGGGAIFEGTSTLTLTACTFTNNEATHSVGGAYFVGSATLTNCVVVGNRARSGGGGGLWFYSGGTVINSTFYNNTATDLGGGIRVGFSDADLNMVGVQNFPFILQNSLLIGNTVAGVARQVFVNNTDATHLVNIQNNLIEGGADPLGTDQGVRYTTPGAENITEENTVDESDVAVVFASTDAMNTNYLRLADGSPAATAGNNDYLNNGTPGNPNDDITTDAAGEIRIQGGTVDVGAYESDLKLAQAITFTAPAAGELGDTIILTTTTNSGLSVTLVITDQTPTSGTGNVVTLMGDVLILTSTGTVTITASQAGDATYVPATVMQTITVRPVGAVIFRVTTTGAGNQSGSSWANAATLQAALAAAVVADDQIWIAAGKYHPVTLANDTTTATNEERAATFNIPTSVLVYGGFAGDEASFMPDDPTTPENEDIRTRDPGGALTNVTILSGDLLNDDGTRPTEEADGETHAAYNTRREENSHTVVTLTGANTTLDGLTIQDGEGGTDLDGAGPETRIGGAGLYAGTGTTGATLTGCAFNNNSADANGNGGGAYFREAATLMSCAFTGNTAGFGGGAWFNGASTLTGCTFTGNETGGIGGGAYFEGIATLTGCAFTNNTAEFVVGGGAYFEGIATLTGCTFTGNRAIASGGASFSESSTLTDCVFTGNRGDDGASFYGVATLTGCTFTGHESYSAAEFYGRATLANCVVVDNPGGGGLGFSAGGTVINSTFYNTGIGIRVSFNDIDSDTPGVQTNPFNLQNSLLMAADVSVSNTDTAHLVNIQNNLIAGGADPRGTDQGVVYTTPGSANITEENTVDESDVAVVFASTDPMNTNYLRLADGSPAATAGNNDYLNNGTPDNPNDDITTDAAGEIRIQGGTVDVGAYESDLKLAQAITFTAPAAGELGDTITLTTTTDSGLPVTLVITDQTPTSGTGNVVTLMGDVLTLTSTGTVTITASQAGDATYVPATVMQTITVRPVGAVIFRVTTTGAGNQSGSSWANAATLQAALAAAVVADDQIWIAAGKYHPATLANDATTATNEERAATFNVPTSVLVYGGFAGDEAGFTPDDPTTPANEDTRTRDPGGVLTNVTILSGDLLNDDGTRPARPVQPAAGEDQTAYNAALVVYDAARAAYNTRREENSLTVVTLTGANTTLDGLTITAGEGGTDLDGAGPEMRIGGAGLYAGTGITGITLMGCAFNNNNNVNGNGGGAYFREAATLTACTFTGNTAGFGGGAWFNGASTLTGCAFTGNTAEFGGGASFRESATLTGCVFTGNKGDGGGGGAGFGAATLTACTFIDNEGGDSSNEGGGAYFDGTATLTACTFTGNEGGNFGGAVFGGGATLTNCVVVGNSGGGLEISAGGTVINSTFYNNTGVGIEAYFFSDIDSDTPGVQTNPFILQNSLLIGNTVAGVARQVSVNNTDAAHLVNIQNNLIAGGADPLGTDQGVVYTTPGSANITEENTVDESDVAVVFASTDPMNTNYLRLRTGSPAVNTGNDDYLNNGTPGNPDDDIKIDVAGEVRNQGGSVDLGAYESPFQAQMLAFTLAANGTSGAVIPLSATSQDVEGMPTGLLVTYASSDITVAMVRAAAGDRQELVLLAPGTATITASRGGGTTAGNVIYEAATDVDQEIMVSAATQTLTFTLANTGMSGDVIPLEATVNSGLPVTYESSAPAIAEVRNVAVGQELLLKMPGRATITASREGGVSAGNVTYTAATAVAQEIMVSTATQVLVFNSTAMGEVGETIALDATGGASGQAVGFEITGEFEADGTTRATAGTVATFNAGTGVLTLVGVGEVEITARQAGGINAGTTYAAATPVTQTITVSQGTQTVTITSGNTGQATINTIALTATAVNASGVATGSAITYEIVRETPTTRGDDVADLPTGSNLLALRRQGTVEIRATAAGDVNTYAEATDTQVITVSADPVFDQTFTFNLAAGGTSGDEITLTATSRDVDGNEITGLPDIVYAIASGSNNPTTRGDVATLAAGVLTLASPGMISITASREAGRGDDGKSYGAATAVTQEITVSAAMQTLTFNLVADSTSGTVIPLTATAQNADGDDITALAELPAITYTSSEEGFAMVRAAGGGQELLLKAPGTATITALRGGGTVGGVTYAAATDVTQTITVSQGTQTITFTSDTTGNVGTNIELAATASSTLPVTFEITEGDTLATLADNTLSLTGVGTVTITATQEGNVNYADTMQTQTITVSQGAQTITFTSDTTGTVGTNIELAATASSTLPVTFEITEGDTLATLADNTLSLTGVGTVTITATQEGNTNYADTMQTQIITVSQGTQTITFTSDTTGTVGTNIELAATASSGLPVTFAITEGDTLATLVDSTLSLTGVGTVTITATQEGNANYADTMQTQIITVSQGTQTITFTSDTTGNVGTNIELAATASSTLPVTFEITTGDTLATLADNTLSLTGIGTVTITATQEGNANYADTMQTQTITVSQGTQTITFTSDTTGNVGTNIELAATASSTLPVTFEITTGDTLATLADNTLSLTGVGTVTITATQEGNANYADTMQTQTIMVSQGTQTITFTSDTTGNVGTNIELAATASSTLPVTFEITTGDTLATLADNTLSLTGIGTVTITATQEGKCELCGYHADTNHHSVARDTDHHIYL